jgi:hypothetical protein
MISTSEGTGLRILVKVYCQVEPPIRVWIIMTTDVKSEWTKGECCPIDSRWEAVELVERENWRGRVPIICGVNLKGRVYRFEDVPISYT